MLQYVIKYMIERKRMRLLTFATFLRADRLKRNVRLYFPAQSESDSLLKQHLFHITTMFLSLTTQDCSKASASFQYCPSYLFPEPHGQGRFRAWMLTTSFRVVSEERLSSLEHFDSPSDSMSARYATICLEARGQNTTKSFFSGS